MPSAFTVRAPTPRLNWEAIKDRIDLEAVAVDLLGDPPGRKGGGRLWWPCPFHDDRNPSFVVDPDWGRWKCFGCGEHGDAAALAMRLNRSTFPEAVRRVAELSGLLPSGGSHRPMLRPTPAKAPARPSERPSGLPPADALALVKDAARRLWEPEGAAALAYLHRRGLEDDAIRAARLGYVDSVAIPTKGGDRSYRASGIVLPWFDGERLALVKIRRPEGEKPKYVEAFRDRPRIYPGPEAIQSGRPLIVVEGEFDALLMAQQLPDVASVVTLGSASARPDSSILGAMLAAPRWFIATDADDAGDKAATGWPSRAVRVRPPEGCNDWTEVHAGGFSRIRYLWGRWLPMSVPWEELEPLRWGPASTDTDAYEAAERLAIQAEGDEPDKTDLLKRSFE
ncbi:CHC2 zinc finger domain-containing protein [Planctomyces sp. SH-PL62]|uniref:CHC2 zinc finger domain-containing protein n=1 Tax=Planctomyces sp. SH-PL62 TaxID=1636152 RepID=UPI00078EDEFE|nr:CHC2 zinc finger domain-containing protein [Planctomyces sp. SH-PL62]AMV38783.1 DNA primase [Planctomyces sp. SH-PL62]